MKIKLNKYIFFYIILIFISIIFYFNLNFFKSFFSNLQDYTKITYLKTQDPISFGKYDYNLELSNIDISNLRLLNQDFSWAKSLIYKTNQYSYKDLYNLWNIYLLQAYKYFSTNKTWSIDLTKKALAFYETSLKNIPLYKSKKPIISNLNISQTFLNFLYVYSCDNLFIKMISKIKKIDDLISDVLYILKKQHNVLDNRSKYKDLKYCIQSFKNDIDNNIYTLYETKIFFNKVNSGLGVLLKDFQWNEVSCYQQSPIIKSKYKESILSSYDYYKKFLYKQKQLLEIFEKANKKQMDFLCNNKQKLANKQKQENEKMKNNFNKLRDLIQKQQAQQKKKNQQEQQNKENNKARKHDNNKKEKGNKNYKWDKDSNKIDKMYNEKIESLEKQNKNLIEQIQKEKTQDNYNPLEYLNELFKEFYANDKDFKEGIKKNNIGK